MGFIPGPSDPFLEFMVPPADETPAQRTARLKREQDAQRDNDRIEEEIKQHKAELKKEKGIVKVLLLGQSESGKSTILKNFRMRYAHEEWERERNGWRAVIQLNAVKAINTILNFVEGELDRTNESSPTSDVGSDPQSQQNTFGDRHRRLLIRLSALKTMETDLKRRFGAATDDTAPMSTAPQVAFPETESEEADPEEDPEEFELPPRSRFHEAAVRSWSDVLLPGGSSMDSTASISDDVTITLANCKEDMKALWKDKAVRRALQRRKLVLSDTSAFFLGNLDRIASHDYSVTDDDIVHARLRTIGIKEYRLTFRNGPWDSSRSGRENGWQWKIYDVGGCRTLRAAWLPFFHNVNVIIFVAPVSVFDQRLEEDKRVNRLEDSVNLWISICSSKMLAKTQLILFLNKCDLLHKKIKRGVRVADFLPSYRDRSNSFDGFLLYLKEKFKDIQKEKYREIRRELSGFPETRHTYIFPTTATDTSTTGRILETVRDGILRDNLAASQLI